jgi:ABC-type Fe3+/spermidine/putrescine transport system ATPase subunit
LETVRRLQARSLHAAFPMTAILEIRELVKHFPGHPAVKGISLSLDQGRFYSLLGPSGCGKTTTLRLIAGFEEPTSGEIRLNGNLLNGTKPYDRNVSTVFQSYALFPHLTVQSNVEFGLRQKKIADFRAKAEAVIRMVQLEGKNDRLPSQLSGGERQRVALARSLVVAPDVLLLDEPLAALDPKLRKQMRAELKEMQRRAGITFLFVTHDQEEALSLSDFIAVMNRGSIEQFGTPEDVYLRPATRFVAGFLGSVNWIDGAGVRPESMRVSRTAPGEGSRERRAQVTRSVFLGNVIQVHARLESGEEVQAELPRGMDPFEEGEAVYIHWSEQDEMRFG